jgi:hypothetical protein
MTLNIALLTSDRLYVSTDFKLSDGRREISVTSTKVVVLKYPRFDGFVNYTGVGRWPTETSRDTSDRVIEWLEGKRDLEFDDIVEVIRAEGDRFLADVERRLERKRHTFTVAGFSDGRAVIAVVSNFETVTGETFTDVRAQLEVSTKTVRGGPLVVITGARGSVDRAQRRALERLATQHDDPERIRVALGDLNRAASQSPEANGTISEDCTVISIRSEGSGFQNVPGASRVEFLQLINGIHLDLSRWLPAQYLSTARVTGASFATSKPPSEAPVCGVEIGSASNDRFDVIEIRPGSAGESRAKAIDEDGVVAGYSAVDEAPGYSRYWRWSRDDGFSALTDLVTRNPQVVCSPNSHLAFLPLLTQTEHVPRLIAPDGTDRQLIVPTDCGEVELIELTSVNDSGVVGGVLAFNLDSSDGARFRPVIWDSTGPTVLPDEAMFGNNWGRVIAVSPEGNALVWLKPPGLSWENAIAIWDVGASQIRAVCAAVRSVIPVSFLPDGGVLGVLGFYNDDHGDPVAVVSEDLDSWQPFGTGPGWYPTAASADGSVTGRVTRAGYLQPWMRRASGGLEEVPPVAYHNCTPLTINSSDWILGEASTDHGHHLVVWIPRDA